MSGETSNIALMAEKVSNDLFKWFRWELVGTTNQNYPCHKNDLHNTKSDTHPCDVVFRYHDPYLNQYIYFNTDLKSYAKGSITSTAMRTALISLAETIDCAEGSPEWQEAYQYAYGSAEVRGMLFVYNHDGDFDQNFYDIFNTVPATDTKKGKRGVDIDNIPLTRGQKIHIVEPRIINYLQSILSDIHKLAYEGTFPAGDDYQFYYPDLILHKVNGSPSTLPATIESLTGPYFIVKHGPTLKINDSMEKIITFEPGYVVYYNGEGRTELEFIYIFDTLSKFQLLNEKSNIRLRLIHPNINHDIRAIYKKAIETYVMDWGFDNYKRSIIEAINFELVDFVKPRFSSIDLGWRD
ncbi:hypothetical protein G5647_14630 [Pectobacterium carotovorum]|uniref:hypothetical protein n=1 Tax=Pectobacterium carotovorum TaxID=554 RepID=UPI00191D059A|nr:hypothetical protein [Pectobacterium carotovorum]MBL0867661.1 hypothetical protein [Pectobacterium carotovorum]